MAINLFRPRSFCNFNKSTSNLSQKMIAVLQITSSNNKEKNYDRCSQLVTEASIKGANIAFLPEGCDYIAESKKECIHLAEQYNGALLKQYCKLASSLNIWLSIGGIHIKDPNEQKISNSHLVIDNHGKVVSTYSKTHLFNVEIPEKKIFLKESSYVKAGEQILSPVQTPCGNLALGICYDMRFPELSLLQRKMGAQILTYPSAFTVPTGEAHWHSLLRARAIETQCYVVAAAQTGQHNLKRSSYGHALVVDPYGKIIAEVEKETGFAMAEIDLHYLEKIRLEMPVFSHRRFDLYSLHGVCGDDNKCRLTEITNFPSNSVSYKFGQLSVPGSCVFLKTSNSQAFTNKKIVTPGHVLLTPERIAINYSDLNEAEVGDLAQSIVLVLKVLRKEYPHSPKMQIAIQDGVSSGRTIEHLHVHLMPSAALKQGYKNKEDSRWRTEEEMAAEAKDLRVHIKKLSSDSWLVTSAFPRCLNVEAVEDDGVYRLSSGQVEGQNVFLKSEFSFARLAPNEILPGHSYVCCCRKVSSLEDMSPREVVDLMLCVQRVERHLQQFFHCSSSTIFISDETESEKNLVVHVIPRKENDIVENDDIYELLLSHKPNLDLMKENELFLFLKNKFYPPKKINES